MPTKRNELGVYAGLPEETTCETASCPRPLAFLEYTWYVHLAYAMLGQVWGVVIPSVGGALLTFLAAACFFSIRAQASRVYAPVALAFCTGVSVIAVQFFFYSSEALSNSIIFIQWLFVVIIVQALSLRPQFLHRFALAATAIGLGALPYIQVKSDAGVVRAWGTGTGISNPNSLGMWFGFCTVYFVLRGFHSRDLMVRTFYWVGALGCLYVVTLTVSRGPLLGIALACVVGLMSILKRYFVPVLSLVFLIWLAYEFGVFQQAVDSYSVRGTVESGRGTVFPLALQRLLDSPWTGVGMEAIPTRRPSGGVITTTTPHNALLYLGLAAGIIPLICFLGYLARAARGALLMWSERTGDVMVLPPLALFAVIETMNLDTAFMSAWGVVVFGLAAAAQDSSRDLIRRRRVSHLSSPGDPARR